MRPDSFRLFAFYHLGFDDELRYRFRNLHAAARNFGATPEEILTWLKEARMDPDVVCLVDFNLAAAHAEAQQLDMAEATLEVRAAFARGAYAAYLAALEQPLAESPIDRIDYDNPLGVRRPPEGEVN